MAQIMTWLRLERMSLLQSFIFLCSLTLIGVLSVIVVEFQGAESLRQHYDGDSTVNGWILPSLVALVLLTVAVGIVLMASLFYRWKLRKPLDILMKASEKISSNDLGFRISYESKDELGELCRVFEIMRAQLEMNYKTLWRSVEERKQLNAIFAHDLRTPLSVLKGNFEFLTTFLPQNKITQEKLLDVIQTMNVHIVRLEHYTEAMSSIQKLEDIPVRSSMMETEQLMALLNESARQIIRQSGKSFNTSITADSNRIAVDSHLVLQVFENITANAARFAANHVNIKYCIDKGYLSITVTEDGPGFSKVGLRKAMLPFYRGEVSHANEHRGLGLYICKILCEKHEGSLDIDNVPGGGGQVTASFLTGLINR
ncbi:HAMP domain-containing sensor histidine kinase [Paenibacillus whitsoniae]|uniref:histidine kinase n=1 Tax=Paenibacillus whitsoniae TaxID=2496558 RepID=A0A3S0ACT6_9BACL|nr:HAMP domain-containing sensor histidine kinase [Paenibacillus whitsoniae]RTE09997.1 HAMP domain-containing histidine kinase [Paenibacillus whitsoniae]